MGKDEAAERCESGLRYEMTAWVWGTLDRNVKLETGSRTL